MAENSSNSNESASTGVAAAGMRALVGSVSDTISKSGASDLVSSVGASIPQTTKDYIADAQSKLFSRDQLRSPTVFFGIGEEKPFYIEKIPSLIVERVRHNISFFYLNYILMTSILFVLTMLVHPVSLIGIVILGLAWMGLLRASKDGSLELSMITLTQKQASLGMTVISALVLFWLLKNIFWWTLGSSSLIVASHLLFRDASMHKDEEDKVLMTGDIALNSEDSFLNPVEKV